MADKNATPLSPQEAPWTHWMERGVQYAHFPLRLALVAVFTYRFIAIWQDPRGYGDTAGVPVFAAVLAAVGLMAIVGLVIAGAMENLPQADAATRLAGFLTTTAMLFSIGFMHAGRWDAAATAAHPLGGMEHQVTLALIGLYLMLRGNRI